jgi:hypothetical protein
VVVGDNIIIIINHHLFFLILVKIGEEKEMKRRIGALRLFEVCFPSPLNLNNNGRANKRNQLR